MMRHDGCGVETSGIKWKPTFWDSASAAGQQEEKDAALAEPPVGHCSGPTNEAESWLWLQGVFFICLYLSVILQEQDRNWSILVASMEQQEIIN